jgi:hypothetical protein
MASKGGLLSDLQLKQWIKAGKPLSKRVAALAGLVLIDIGAPAKQAAEERDLFVRGQRRARRLAAPSVRFRAR